jgi:hypothetical protein
MDEVTTSLGKAFRLFSDKICTVYNTKELPKEARARRRRRDGKPMKSSSDGPIKKKFNLQTYKYHSLDDYT